MSTFDKLLHVEGQFSGLVTDDEIPSLDGEPIVSISDHLIIGHGPDNALLDIEKAVLGHMGLYGIDSPCRVWIRIMDERIPVFGNFDKAEDDLTAADLKKMVGDALDDAIGRRV